MKSYTKWFWPVAALILATLLAVAPKPVYAGGPWYVSTTGNDGQDCLGPLTACANINGALTKPGFTPDDTVLVAGGVYTATGSEVALLNKDAMILGGWDSAFAAQDSATIIDGQQARRGLTVNGGISATLQNLVIQGGTATQGGAIYTGGRLMLKQVIVQDNTALGGGNSGGGIYNAVGGTLIISDSEFNSNSADRGGGIQNTGTRITVEIPTRVEP